MAEHAIVETHELVPWVHGDGIERQIIRVTCSCGGEQELLSRGTPEVRAQQVANLFARHQAGAKWPPANKRPSAYAQGRRRA